MSRRSESVWQGARGNGLGSPLRVTMAAPGRTSVPLCDGRCGRPCQAVVERRSRAAALHVMDRLPIVLTLEERGSRGSVAREGGVPQ
jgi:hypothetical protein